MGTISLRLSARAAGIVAVALGVAVMARAALLLALAPHPPGVGVRGAFHVHSNLSDGRGSPEDVAVAAAAAGLDFVVLSDHNRLAEDELAVRHGVLMIPATEESTAYGHLISLGARRALNSQEKSQGADPVRAVRELGGQPIAAHPLNLREPWSRWDFSGELAGIEVLSFDDLWREALHSPFSSGLPWAAMEWWVNPRLGILDLLHRETETLRRADELEAEHPLAMLCSVDAHGLPDYRSVFEALSMHVDGLSRPLRVEQAPEILKALAAGQAYCGVDSVAGADGFRFAAEPGSKLAPVLLEGMEGTWEDRELLVSLPEDADVGAEVHYFRDGHDLFTAPGSSRLMVPGPGVYRVEVWAKYPALVHSRRGPWILSNPIRLR